MNGSRTTDLWTQGAPKWAIAITTAAIGVAGLAWSIVYHPGPGELVESSSITDKPTIAQGASEAVPNDATELAPIETPAPSAYARRINVNTVSAAELELLPGIGPALAGRIIESRQTEGPFATPADIERVRGIGPATRAKIEPLIAFE